MWVWKKLFLFPSLTCRIGSGAHWVKLFWVLPLLIILHGFYWNALPILGWFHWLLMRCIKGFRVVFFHPSSGSSYVNFDRFCICFQFPFCVALFLNFQFFFDLVLCFIFPNFFLALVSFPMFLLKTCWLWFGLPLSHLSICAHFSSETLRSSSSCWLIFMWQIKHPKLLDKIRQTFGH